MAVDAFIYFHSQGGMLPFDDGPDLQLDITGLHLPDAVDVGHDRRADDEHGPHAPR